MLVIAPRMPCLEQNHIKPYGWAVNRIHSNDMIEVRVNKLCVEP